MSIPTGNTLKSNSTSILTRFFACCFSLYLSLVLYLTLFDSLNQIILLPILFVVICSLTIFAENRISEQHICLTQSSPALPPLAFFAVAFSVVLCGQLLYWFSYYPGGFNLDAYGQWDQIHGLQHLNNWHPVLTTGFYWLITRLNDSFAFCILVQLILFSASVAYLLLVLQCLHIRDTLLIAVAFCITLNPAVSLNNVCLFKDVPFTIIVVWITVVLIRIVMSGGKWMDRMLHRILLVTLLVMAAMIRHNGIFYILPLLICLLLLYKKQRLRIFAMSFTLLALLTAIQGPLFDALSIEQHSNVTGESVGIPMAAMANVYLSDPENTPEGVESFLLSIASEEEWREHYVLGEWDSCKWEFGGIELFKDNSIKEFIPLFFKAVIAAPEAAYQAVRENTRVVWQVFGNAEWDTWVYVEDNDYGIESMPNPKCKIITENLLTASLTSVGTACCWNIGVPNLMLIMMSWESAARRKYQNLLYVVPIVAYNLLTMLLLCGPSHRYFYFNAVIFTPILLAMLAL